MIAIYWVWRLGILLTSLAPRRLSFLVAGFLGNTGYYLMPLRRRIAHENFSYVLGRSPNDFKVRTVARKSFQNFARQLRDVMIYPDTSLQELEKRITFCNPEHIHQALKSGKGAIIVSAHFGNMDLPGALLAHRFAPVTIVAETLRPQQLMDWLTQVRAERKVQLFPYDRAPRRILEALKRNELTAFLLDFGITHHFDMITVPVTFFGKQTNFPAGPAQLALLTGAPIVVGHACVLPDGHINVHVNPPFHVERSGNRRHDFQIAMQHIAGLMEEFIRLHPEQWYMFRPMWKDGHAGRALESDAGAA